MMAEPWLVVLSDGPAGRLPRLEGWLVDDRATAERIARTLRRRHRRAIVVVSPDCAALRRRAMQASGGETGPC